ncbi:MAG: helix-turn-helix domain-containing protein [Hyphomicrobiaceae bacterium]
MLRSIDLKLRERLNQREFRLQWFRAQLEVTVPDMFRSLREDRDLTQKELAECAEMKQSAISRFEKSDEANWKLETLLKIADALDAQLVISLIKAEDVIARYESGEDHVSKNTLSRSKQAAGQPDDDKAGVAHPLRPLAEVSLDDNSENTPEKESSIDPPVLKKPKEWLSGRGQQGPRKPYDDRLFNQMPMTGSGQKRSTSRMGL